MFPWDSVADLLKTGIDKIWPDAGEANRLKTELEKALIDGKLRDMELQYENAKYQLKVNEAEAKSTNPFVSSWRPFIGWVCGAAFAYKYIIYPFLVFLCAILRWDIDVSNIPVIDMGEMMPVLLGMLGLGYMRTHEKTKGVAS